ncbi:5'-deoxynucleotidase [Pectobacteriaceae bacterium CE90]|nr:5'-deoxynucleotidase [Prodigiosinella sp. LS101]WJV52536.1 5'-deoxynucleotidase [Prodigiosinella sp. LS101]WJV56890.1 5'-deoxynucleotidase [Pectobacteriaceae bacterium C111]WJY16442.1 5'-deoxynucleotidase [Pectobacteriaceae bacterium CE90]
MVQSHFFAHLSRLKLIVRWPLMRNVRMENVSEHSLQVAFVAHALAIIKNRKFNGNLNAERIALLAMYHDASEVLTGDMPTPIKYYNAQIAHEYKKIEKIAQQKLIEMLPAELQQDYSMLLDDKFTSEDEHAIVKQADTLCAYLKCLEELSAGNNEFLMAKARLEKTLQQRQSPEMDYFVTIFIPSFSLSLDEISQDSPL